jgi:F-type H+-transporting ATPase subunit delta
VVELSASTSSSAKRYAEAIFDIAKSSNSFDLWSTELAAMAQVQSDPKLGRLLSSPALELSVKEEVLARALPDVSRETGNLVKLLLHKGRFGLASRIAGYYRAMLNDYRGIATAQVTSAVPLNEAERGAVADRLSTMTGRKVVVESEVDPSIIGGIVARIGDQLIDASVRGRLEALKRRLATQ